MSTQLRLIKGTGGQSNGQGSTTRSSASRGTGRARAPRTRRHSSSASHLSARTLADLRLDAQTRDRGIQGVAEARRRLASLQPPEPSLSQAS